MAQSFRNGFQIIAVLQGKRCVTVPQIMEAQIRPSHIGEHLFNVPFDSVRVKMFSEFVCKHKVIFILPKFSGFKPLFALAFFVFLQKGDNGTGEGTKIKEKMEE